ncbi:hypothetical protein DI09_12p160 [Mitosporidium daphniae]|uniref:Uncharacterized protein n=1 Tax=Mitosporidium daphniae TaxID=1485682 RepID=A0A098VUS5_9MICR|nr:uncharacterized protein DI09_12p160 [Mitosporidium daphniae]KGG52848.1 hypothetical protein DI09_12p160 [Mitosporidium daphniae]|eukprot:XP_013239275.1 uncharacterized protein DI09_12p160 [Mitosporidium daphniae]
MSLSARRECLRGLLAQILEECSMNTAKISDEIAELRPRLISLERIRWNIFTQPSIKSLCSLYQIEHCGSIIKVANLFIPEDGDIYSKSPHFIFAGLPYEQTNALLSIFLTILDVFHKRILSPPPPSSASFHDNSSSRLPCPIVRMPGASPAIQIGQKSINSTETTSDILITPAIPELPVNKVQKISEVERNNWIMALAAISFNAIWLASKIWKRVTERCNWSPRQNPASISENLIIPRAIAKFFVMISIIEKGELSVNAQDQSSVNAQDQSSVNAQDQSSVNAEDEQPAYISDLLEFMYSSGMVEAFSHLSSFTKFFDEIEYFWERHAKE